MLLIISTIKRHKMGSPTLILVAGTPEAVYDPGKEKRAAMTASPRMLSQGS